MCLWDPFKKIGESIYLSLRSSMKVDISSMTFSFSFGLYYSEFLSAFF